MNMLFSTILKCNYNTARFGEEKLDPGGGGWFTEGLLLEIARSLVAPEKLEVLFSLERIHTNKT